jgi:hypothetical protein
LDEKMKPMFGDFGESDRLPKIHCQFDLDPHRTPTVWGFSAERHSSPAGRVFHTFNPEKPGWRPRPASAIGSLALGTY